MKLSHRLFPVLFISLVSHSTQAAASLNNISANDYFNRLGQTIGLPLLQGLTNLREIRLRLDQLNADLDTTNDKLVSITKNVSQELIKGTSGIVGVAAKWIIIVVVSSILTLYLTRILYAMVMKHLGEPALAIETGRNRIPAKPSKILSELKKKAFYNAKTMEEIEQLIHQVYNAITRKKKSIKVLIVGPPGTGKTLLAKGIVKQMPRWMTLSGGSFSQFQGKGVTKIRELFQWGIPKWSNGYTTGIVLIDESEKFLGHRKDQNAEGKDMLLEWMTLTGDQDQKLAIIAITNDSSAIDPAIIRRFDKVIYIGHSDDDTKANQIMALFQSILRERIEKAEALAIVDKLTSRATERLGKARAERISAANIEGMVRDIAFRTTEIKKPVTKEAIDHAIEAYVEREENANQDFLQ